MANPDRWSQKRAKSISTHLFLVCFFFPTRVDGTRGSIFLIKIFLNRGEGRITMYFFGENQTPGQSYRFGLLRDVSVQYICRQMSRRSESPRTDYITRLMIIHLPVYHEG